MRTLESLARIELGAQGGALVERVTTTRTAKEGAVHRARLACRWLVRTGLGGRSSSCQTTIRRRRLISRVQAMEEELKMLRSGVAVLLHDTTPVPGANVQLRRCCADLGRLLVASRPAEGYDEGPGAPNSPLMRCVGAFLAGFRVKEHRRALGTPPEDLSRASERIRRISRQMCRNRLLPVVVWAGSLVRGLAWSWSVLSRRRIAWRVTLTRGCLVGSS